VVDKLEMDGFSPSTSVYPCQISFRRLLNNHHLSPRAGAIGLDSGRLTNWTQSHPTPNKYKMVMIRLSFSNYSVNRFVYVGKLKYYLIPELVGDLERKFVFTRTAHRPTAVAISDLGIFFLHPVSLFCNL
jgi:hypothetical protein